MKLMTTILVLGMGSVLGWAQAGPTILQNTKNQMHAVQEKKNAEIGAALGAQTTAKPAPSQTAKGQTTKAAPGQTPAKSKPTVVISKPLTKAAPVVVAKAPAKAAAKVVTKDAKSKEPKQASSAGVSVESKTAPEPSRNDKMKTIMASGRRDPFVSPVVSQSATGSGCSTGKRCLAVGQISLKGVVKSETGMIAVVVNALDKAYFLRENDPVFDGYVLKITSDSIVFKETVQDKLGKPFTREVTKKITTPVV